MHVCVISYCINIVLYFGIILQAMTVCCLSVCNFAIDNVCMHVQKGSSAVHYITGHVSKINSIDWSSFSDSQFATCAHDCCVKVCHSTEEPSITHQLTFDVLFVVKHVYSPSVL